MGLLYTGEAEQDTKRIESQPADYCSRQYCSLSCSYWNILGELTLKRCCAPKVQLLSSQESSHRIPVALSGIHILVSTA